MNGTQIIEYFHGLIDNDSLDSDFEYSLLNAAKEKLESEREWEFLKKVDSTKSASTSAIALPTDFLAPLLVYVGDDTQPYMPVPFEQKKLFENGGRFYYTDLANSNYYFLDNSVSGTVYFYYFYSTSDVAAATSPVFPARFHKILAYDMAKMFYGADQSERNFSWSREWDLERKILFDLMCDWDERQKKVSRENGFSRVELVTGLNFDKYGFDISEL
jgi:hypothetical protein